MSNKYTEKEILNFLDDIRQRYENAQSGKEYNFEKEIIPFLNRSDNVCEAISQIPTDFRFNKITKDKLIEQINEISMSCHIEHFKKRLYSEKIKFITMWVNHIIERGLL